MFNDALVRSCTQEEYHIGFYVEPDETLAFVQPSNTYYKSQTFCESERSLYIGMIGFFDDSPLLVISCTQVSHWST